MSYQTTTISFLNIYSAMAPAPIGSQTAAPSSLDSIAKPPDHVVLPPKDLRAIIEKTAGYVARNGIAFEERILEKEQRNPKFGFLVEHDAYHAYYIWRKDEISAGRGTDIAAGRAGEAQVAAVPEPPKGPGKPPEFHFSARMPVINAQDFDVVKLTAYYVARNGRSFINTIAQRQAGNFQFDFLRPQHSLHQFFSRLVDQYTELINLRQIEDGIALKKRVEDLKLDKGDKFRVLERAKKRADWVRFQQEQKQKQDKEAEAEKVAYAEIDWHDFDVAGTIEFDDRDEEAELPPPTSLADLQSASLEQKAAMSLAPNHRRLEEAMPTDDMSHMYNNIPQPLPQHHRAQSSPTPANLPPRPPSGPPPLGNSLPPPPTLSPMPPPGIPGAASPFSPPPTGSPAPPIAANAAPGTIRPGDAPMKIRSDYIPRAQQARAQKAAATLCPYCKQQIPNAEYQNHIKIELLDPRWKEQRAKADSRNATTNLNTADVSSNLKRFASQRQDLFDGVTGEPLSEEESARRKRAALQYDGVISGVEGYGRAAAGREAMANAAAREKVANAMQGVGPQPGQTQNPGQGLSVEEQLKSIKARHGQQ